MKTLTVELPDELYERVERRATELGTSPGQEVLALLIRATGTADDQLLSAARTRMQELFRTVKGFRMGSKISREELYERGSLR